MKGRPILGIVGGFMFGLFGGLTLFLYGAIPLHSDLLWILPLLGIVLGLVFAAWAPFGSRSKAETDPSAPEPAAEETPTEESEDEAAPAEGVEQDSSAKSVVDVDVSPRDSEPTAE